MIVKKSIGAVKINNISNKLTVGKPVPENVLRYWKETKQLKTLLENGTIEDENKKEKVKGGSVHSNASGQSENS